MTHATRACRPLSTQVRATVDADAIDRRSHGEHQAARRSRWRPREDHVRPGSRCIGYHYSARTRWTSMASSFHRWTLLGSRSSVRQVEAISADARSMASLIADHEPAVLAPSDRALPTAGHSSLRGARARWRRAGCTRSPRRSRVPPPSSPSRSTTRAPTSSNGSTTPAASSCNRSRPCARRSSQSNTALTSSSPKAAKPAATAAPSAP